MIDNSQVIAAVRKASVESGTQFSTLLASASLESGLNPAAKASGSTASGLFQFTEQTWLSTIQQFGAAHGLQSDAAAVVTRGGQLTVADPATRQRILNLRFDPAVSSSMAGDHLRSLAGTLAKGIGHAPDAAEVYIGHFLGSVGATQMLQTAQSAPTTLAAAILPAAARGNPTAFYTSSGTPLTASQFVQHVRDRVTRAIADGGVTVPRGPLSLGASGTASDNADGTGAWSARAPRVSVTPAERQMAASLVAVFTRLDQAPSTARAGHGKTQHGLPQTIVSALTTQAGNVDTTALPELGAQ
jgi:hypothetical protein